MRKRKAIPGIDTKLLIKDAAKLLPDPSRRLFLRGAASLGALTMLTGCDIVNGASAENALRAMSGFNDRVQAPEVDPATYKLELTGLIENKTPWTLEQLHALPQEKQVTRHICVEGWSAIGSWTGVRLSEFLQRVGADTRAKYVWFRCAEGYTTSIDMQ